jgi:limonene-1,2-epoxide hydrolase
MSQDIEVINAFIAAFNARDLDGIMSFFSDDPVYHNMPGDPVRGREAVRGLIESFVTPAEKIDWENLNVAQVGDTVLTERVDRFVVGGKDVVLPVMGPFEMRDGKIVEWRDYFDMATWQRQMS